MANKKRSASSSRWLQEHFSDKYVQQAQKKGLRSRAWFKLDEIQQSDKLFKPGMTVVDLGAAPGGWSQYVVTQIGGTGRIYGLWVITSISETQQVFFEDGTPRRYEFTINLKRIDDGRIDMLGSLAGIVGGALRGLL